MASRIATPWRTCPPGTLIRATPTPCICRYGVLSDSQRATYSATRCYFIDRKPYRGAYVATEFYPRAKRQQMALRGAISSTGSPIGLHMCYEVLFHRPEALSAAYVATEFYPTAKGLRIALRGAISSTILWIMDYRL